MPDAGHRPSAPARPPSPADPGQQTRLHRSAQHHPPPSHPVAVLGYVPREVDGNNIRRVGTLRKKQWPYLSNLSICNPRLMQATMPPMTWGASLKPTCPPSGRCGHSTVRRGGTGS